MFYDITMKWHLQKSQFNYFSVYKQNSITKLAIFAHP